MIVLEREIWLGTGTDILVFSLDPQVSGVTLTRHTGRVFGLTKVFNEIWSASFDKTIVRWSIAERKVNLRFTPH